MSEYIEILERIKSGTTTVDDARFIQQAMGRKADLIRIGNQDYRKLAIEHADLLRILGMIEWGNLGDCCSVCGRGPEMGHAEKCPVGNVIAGGSVKSAAKLPLWVIMHTHRHGADVYPVYAQECPEGDDVFDLLGDAWEADKDEDWDISGPYGYGEIVTL